MGWLGTEWLDGCSQSEIGRLAHRRLTSLKMGAKPIARPAGVSDIYSAQWSMGCRLRGRCILARRFNRSSATMKSN